MRNSTTRTALALALTAGALSLTACKNPGGTNLGDQNSAVAIYQLKLSVVGTGAGSVAWTDGNERSGTCTGTGATVETCSGGVAGGEQITLTATPTGTAEFAGWIGACSGTSTTCTLTITQNATVEAAFSTTVNPTLTVSASGLGVVTSSPTGIDCGSGNASCSAEFTGGTAITLTASPNTSQTFVGWSGAGCSGTGTCVVTITAGTYLQAFFSGTTFQLTVSLSGTGSGTVVSSIVSGSGGSISCGTGGLCDAPFTPLSVVTLTPTATSGSVFTGWVGDGCSGLLPCTTTLTGNTSVNAIFATPGTGAPSADISTVSVSPSSVNAACTTCTPPTTPTALVTVVLRDANGNPLSGQTVSLSGSGSSNVFNGGSSIAPTDATGTTTATVSSTVAQTETITAVADAVTIAQAPTLTFSALPGNLKGRVVVMQGSNYSAPWSVTGTGCTGSNACRAGAGIYGATVTVDGYPSITAQTLQAGQGTNSVMCDGTTATEDGMFTICGVPAGVPVTVTVTPPAALATTPSPLPTSGLWYNLFGLDKVAPGGLLPADTRIGVSVPANGSAWVIGNTVINNTLQGPESFDINMTAYANSLAPISGSTCGCHSASRYTPLGNNESYFNSAHYRSLATVYPTPDYAAATGLNTNELAQRVINPTVASFSRSGQTVTHIWPEADWDTVDTSYQATNPNYDPNDPCIYGALSSGTCADGVTSPGPYTSASPGGAGVVEVYLCNAATGATYPGYQTPDYLMQFGGGTCFASGAAVYAATGSGADTLVPYSATPQYPLVHIGMLYGGAGDKLMLSDSGAMSSSSNTSWGLGQYQRPNLGTFEQMYQAYLPDVKAANVGATWATPAYTSGFASDSLTLPVYVVQSGDGTSNGTVPVLASYHATEAAYPGESWTQRTRAFSRACSGCHNTALKLTTAEETITPPYPLVSGGTTVTVMNELVTTSYGTGGSTSMLCEHCHGPGSTHTGNSEGKAVGVMNPNYTTAAITNMVCTKCHGYAEGQGGQIPLGGSSYANQTIGFGFPWSSQQAAITGNSGTISSGSNGTGTGQLGNFAGWDNISNYFYNWGNRAVDDQAFWDPSQTGGTLFGQEHRQQASMFAESVHANNSVSKMTCISCHDPHGTQQLTAKTLPEAAATTSAGPWTFGPTDSLTIQNVSVTLPLTDCSAETLATNIAALGLTGVNARAVGATVLISYSPPFQSPTFGLAIGGASGTLTTLGLTAGTVAASTYQFNTPVVKVTTTATVTIDNPPLYAPVSMLAYQGDQPQVKSNVFCLTCHAAGGAADSPTNPFKTITADDLAAVTLANNGTVQTAPINVSPPTSPATNSTYSQGEVLNIASDGGWLTPAESNVYEVLNSDGGFVQNTTNLVSGGMNACVASGGSCNYNADCCSYSCNTQEAYSDGGYAFALGTCAAPTAYTVSGISVSGTGPYTAVLTVSASTAFYPGQPFTVVGVNPSTFDGTFTTIDALTKVDAGSGDPTISTLTYSMATNPGTYVSGGSLTEAVTGTASLLAGVTASQLNIATVVVAHMRDSATMANVQIAQYDPLNDAFPVGRCVTCHMPKVAKSGGYTTGTDVRGDKTVLMGDEASHVFTPIMPYQSKALSRQGPTFQSAWLSQSTGGTSGTTYDSFAYMPNSCNYCHTGPSPAMLYCPNQTAEYPAGFPFSSDLTAQGAYNNSPLLESCVTSTNAN